MDPKQRKGPSLIVTYGVVSLALCVVLTLLVWHAPRWVKRLVVALPSWLWAGLIHFGYAGWMGGVTGHLLGAFVSLPMLGIIHFIIQPMFAKELANVNWEETWLHKNVIRPVKDVVDSLKAQDPTPDCAPAMA
jgi:hypothetical protein